MLQKIDRWIYITLYQKRQHSDFLIHCTLFRNTIKKKTNKKTKPKHCDNSLQSWNLHMQEQKEFWCKTVCEKEIAKYLGVRTSAIIMEGSREQQRPSIQSQIPWVVIRVSLHLDILKKW